MPQVHPVSENLWYAVLLVEKDFKQLSREIRFEDEIHYSL